jgi:hypothetical protein
MTPIAAREPGNTLIWEAVSRQNVIHPQNERLGEQLESHDSDKILAMIVLLRHLFGWMVSAFSSREDLLLENLALRQQFARAAHQTTSPSIDCPA